MPSSGKTALILGATGATGRHLLRELLSSNEWSKVGEYGRRVTPESSLPENSRNKLKQKTIDFENLADAGLKDGRWDVVFITLGTTRAKTRDPEMFEKIDREYVVNACQAAKTDDPTHEQKVVYVSSVGANPLSRHLYLKSKGLTELALARLGYAETIVFRPGFIREARRTSVIEIIASYVSSAMSHFSSSIEIRGPILASAIAKAGALGASGLPKAVGAVKCGQDGAWFTAIGNKGAVVLGSQQ